MRPQGVSSGITDQLYSGRNDPLPDDPMDLVDAERRRTALVREKKEIESVLSNRNLTDENGRRIGDRAYQTQRQKLVKRFNRIDSRLAYLNNWIKEKSKEVKLASKGNDAFMDSVVVELKTISDSVRRIGALIRDYTGQ